MDNHTYFEKYFWFMFGLIQANLFDLFNWWALIAIPFYFIITYLLRKLWYWKPTQRTLRDYK